MNDAEPTIAHTEPSLHEQVERLPTSPGVYFFKTGDKIIYVGKAKNLKSRVRNYFAGSDGRTQVPFIINEATTIEVLLTDNEKEALLLENNLIKQHQPRYNVELKDDKHYLCLRIDPKARFPRVEITRRMRKDGARYFGPYHSATAIRQSIRLLNRHFQLRTCKDSVFKNRTRPCLQYEIKRCPGPCVFEVDVALYQQSVEDVIAFLEGREGELKARLKDRMIEAAKHEEFERAAVLRDQLAGLEQVLQKQRVMTADLDDRDVFGFARAGEKLVIQLLWVRGGKIRGGRVFDLDHAELSNEELLEDALRDYYTQTTELPREVLLPAHVEGQEAFAEWLKERRHAPVDLLVPQRGEKLKLVALANRNAEHRLRTRVETTEAQAATLERLQKSLRLQNYPERIECYDISNTQGGQIVGSQVVFEDGAPARAEYRLYKMKRVSGQDDFQSMHEMLTRRLKRGLEEGELPSLMVIDGGIGQLNVARAVFAELGIEGVDLASLAKSRLLDADQGFLGEGALDERDVLDEARPDETRLDETTVAAPTIAAPTIAAPTIAAPTIAAPTIAAPTIAAPTIAAPIIAAPTIAAPTIAAPTIAAPTTSPATAPSTEKRSPERIFLPGQKNPIVFKPYAQELLLLTHLRDEAHRFAITFHRKLRKKHTLASALDELPGFGPKRKKALLKHFGSLKGFMAAPESALADIPDLPEKLAREAQARLRGNPAA